MNVLGWLVVIFLILLVIGVIARMIVEMLETLEGTLSLFMLIGALVALAVTAGKLG